MFSADEIIAMATEAGFEWDSLGLRDRLCFEHFAALIAVKRNEENAQLCESVAKQWEFHSVAPYAALQCAAAIRARGTKEGA